MAFARSVEDICNMALLYAGVNIRLSSITQPNSAEAQACNSIYNEHRRNMMSALRWPFAIRRAQLVPYSGSTWDTTVTYASGAMVQYGANVYRSLQAGNAGKIPSDNASAAWWFQVTRDGYAFACPLPDDCLDPIEAWEKPTVSAFAVPQVTFSFKNTDSINLRNPRSNWRAPFKLENANDGTDLQVILTDLDTPILRYTADVSNPSAFPTEFAEALAWDLAGPLARGLRGDEKKGDSCDKKAKDKMAEAFVISMRDQQEDPEPISEFEAAREGAV